MTSLRPRTPSGLSSSSCGSMMSLSPSFEGERKKTMQTTVAIVEENPHRFHIQALKHVPVEQRPAASPSFNFERPHVGCRLGLPSMYQLAPSRSASACSINSIGSEYGTSPMTMAEPASPNPVYASGYSYGKTLPREGGNNITGLGFEDVLEGASLTSASAYPSFSSQISTDSRSSQSQSFKDLSWVDFSKPDLTFATSDGSPALSQVYTPNDGSDIPSSTSTESSRKAKSMMVLGSPSKSSLGHQSLSELELLPSVSSGSLRRLRAKTLSASTSEKGRMYRRKRHAIYGNHAMQLSLSPSAEGHSFSVTPSTPESDMDTGSREPSPCIAAVERKNAAKDLRGKDPLSTTKRNALHILDPNLSTAPGSHLSVPDDQPVAAHASLVHSVKPLRIARTRSKQLLAKLVKPSSREQLDLMDVYRHPIIEDLLDELDIAIVSWQVVSYL